MCFKCFLTISSGTAQLPMQMLRQYIVYVTETTAFVDNDDSGGSKMRYW